MQRWKTTLFLGITITKNCEVKNELCWEVKNTANLVLTHSEVKCIHILLHNHLKYSSTIKRISTSTNIYDFSSFLLYSHNFKTEKFIGLSILQLKGRGKEERYNSSNVEEYLKIKESQSSNYPAVDVHKSNKHM